MKQFLLLIALLLTWNASAQTLSLAGSWRFQLDRRDEGLQDQWFSKTLRDTAQLPGSLGGQGIGDVPTAGTAWTGLIVDRSFFTAKDCEPYRQPGNLKVPFWLQPQKYYVGAAWFQRDIQIPEPWRGARMLLELERAHWETRVWLDGKALGRNESLSTPHEYELGEVSPGPHTLTVRVDNRRIVDIGENSHAISDHTQGNWNGIVGRIQLRMTPKVWIEDLQIYPHVASRSVTVKGRTGNALGRSGRSRLTLSACGRTKAMDIAWGEAFETELDLGREASTWDEFDPQLHVLSARLDEGPTVASRFGLREITTDGTEFLVNGRKTLFRGTLECCVFPETGHPPTDRPSWERLIRTAQSFGLNLLRFHSYCPPEAAFAAADELGLYLRVETCWPNGSTTLGDGLPVDRWIHEETQRILKAYGNHLGASQN